MPAAKKVSRDEIIDAAVEVLRNRGFSAINARSVAKKLGCSTQPIYFSFQNMDELKDALTERAVEMHTQLVRDSLRVHDGNDSCYSSYGMGFVKFAAEEKQLFRWLYLDGGSSIRIGAIFCSLRLFKRLSRNSDTARILRENSIRTWYNKSGI